jgi:hypothetical protein
MTLAMLHLSFCKLSEQNTSYFGLKKKDKIAEKGKIMFSMPCSSLFIEENNLNLSFLLSPKYNISFYKITH